MKQELLLKAFGDLDDKYIAEASRPVPGDVSFGPGRSGSRKKRRTFALALAAALTIALGFSAYAGRVLFGWGGNMEIRASKTDRGVETNVYVHTESLTEPVSFEDGRMFFIVNDEHIDITDRVSETQPFIYQFADDAGVVHYWIVGKNGPEPEHYGFAEYLHPSDEDWTAGYVARTNNNEAPWLYRAWEELGFDFQHAD